ncbi:MAG: adenylate/guanylate cyclase domain-containing protein [Myxococcota bacterium]|nr:adenylate/guanylate cyclase domain-containing protein [Myxococcota bacterium]
MAKRPTQDSTLARLSLAKDNEDLVLAENSLHGEKLITVARLAMVGLSWGSLVLARRVVELPAGIRDSARALAALGYLLFAVLCYLAVRRQVPNPTRALWIPIILTVVDYSFFTFQGWRNGELGSYAPQFSAAVFALLICFSVARFSRVHVFIATFFSCGAYMFLSMRYRPDEARQHFYVLAILMTLGVLMGMTQGRVRRMFLDLRRRDMLTRFLPRQVAERVMSLGGASLAPVQREVTVMFTDIRDFTTQSEQLPPSVVLKFLDEYFGHMSALVKAHEGIVNKFLGDGLLAVWGVPERLEGHAEKAMRAALDMRRVVEELNQVRIKNGQPPFRIGIGIHTGTVAAGMLGGEQQEYTVIGDAVNLTARIEGLTKNYDTDILVSQATWDQSAGRFRGQQMGQCQVKGRAEPVVVHVLEGLKVPAPPRTERPAITATAT